MNSKQHKFNDTNIGVNSTKSIFKFRRGELRVGSSSANNITYYCIGFNVGEDDKENSERVYLKISEDGKDIQLCHDFFPTINTGWGNKKEGNKKEEEMKNDRRYNEYDG